MRRSEKRIVFPWEAPFLIKVTKENIIGFKRPLVEATLETYHRISSGWI